jgi:hypothetical protein
LQLYFLVSRDSSTYHTLLGSFFELSSTLPSNCKKCMTVCFLGTGTYHPLVGIVWEFAFMYVPSTCKKCMRVCLGKVCRLQMYFPASRGSRSLILNKCNNCIFNREKLSVPTLCKFIIRNLFLIYKKKKNKCLSCVRYRII